MHNYKQILNTLKKSKHIHNIKCYERIDKTKCIDFLINFTNYTIECYNDKYYLYVGLANSFLIFKYMEIETVNPLFKSGLVFGFEYKELSDCKVLDSYFLIPMEDFK